MTTWVCPEHGSVKFVPPGVSKKPPFKEYSGFFCCPVKGCEQRPPKDAVNGGAVQATPVRPAPSPAPRPAAPPAPYVDPSVEGKVCTLMIEAFIGSTRTNEWFLENEAWMFAFAMRHELPGFDERALNERWADVPPPADGDIPF